MAYTYFTKDLLSRPEIDLNAIFAEKQNRAKEINSVNYGLAEIVQWLKDNTNNFKKTDVSFIDVDRQIRRIVFNYYDAAKEANPFVAEEVDKEEGTILEPRQPSEVGGASGTGIKDVEQTQDDIIKSIEEAILSTKDLISVMPDEPSYQEALKSLEDYLDILKMS